MYVPSPMRSNAPCTFVPDVHPSAPAATCYSTSNTEASTQHPALLLYQHQQINVMLSPISVFFTVDHLRP